MFTELQLRNFRSRVDQQGETDCWPWKARTLSGYGRMTIGQKELLAHRIAVMIKTGAPIPDGRVVRHKCDNPLCCNPAHLELGTQKDNVRDMIARGRCKPPIVLGINHGQAKVSEAQVREIRKRYAAGGVSLRDLAAGYPITYKAVRKIVRRETWCHVD